MPVSHSQKSTKLLKSTSAESFLKSTKVVGSSALVIGPGPTCKTNKHDLSRRMCEKDDLSRKSIGVKGGTAQATKTHRMSSSSCTDLHSSKVHNSAKTKLSVEKHLSIPNVGNPLSTSFTIPKLKGSFFYCALSYELITLFMHLQRLLERKL